MELSKQKRWLKMSIRCSRCRFFLDTKKQTQFEYIHFHGESESTSREFREILSVPLFFGSLLRWLGTHSKERIPEWTKKRRLSHWYTTTPTLHFTSSTTTMHQNLWALVSGMVYVHVGAYDYQYARYILDPVPLTLRRNPVYVDMCMSVCRRNDSAN